MKKKSGLDLWRQIFGRKKVQTDQQRIRNILVKEVTYSTALAGFLTHAYNHGHGVRITIQVDGDDCGIAILAHAREPLVEYLAQWSCAQKLVKQDRLDEFDKGAAEYERDRLICLAEVERLQQANALGANSDDAPDREGLGA
jgi:hypothetical protein